MTLLTLVGLVIEPAIILLAGYLLGHGLDLPMLQFLAWVVAIAHFAEQNIIAAQERAQLLDAADNLIEQRMASARLELVQHGKTKPAPTFAPAPDQQALHRQLEAVRTQAAAASSNAAGGE